MRAWIRYTAAIYPNTSWRHEIELLPQEAARLAICRTSFYKLRDLRSCFYVTQLGSEEGQGQPCRPVGSPTSIPSHVEYVYWCVLFQVSVTCSPRNLLASVRCTEHADRYFGILILLLLFPEVLYLRTRVQYCTCTEVRKYESTFLRKEGLEVHYYDTLGVLPEVSVQRCTVRRYGNTCRATIFYPRR